MSNFIIKGKELTIFCFLLLYKILLDVSYILFVHRYYDYNGFILDFNINKYLFSLLAVIVMFYFLPKDTNKPSSIFLQLHFIIMILPMFTLYALMDESSKFFVFTIFIFGLQCWLVKNLPKIKIKRIKKSKYVLYVTLIAITFVVYISMIKANGVPSLKAFNLLEVYEIRGVTVYPFLMAYLVNWQAKVINSFLMSVSYINKNKWMFGVSVLLQLLLYLITGHKSYLFIPIAILFVLKTIKEFDFLKLGSLLASIGILVLLILFKVTNSILLPSIFIRRFLFVPAQLKFYYYDFFSKNELLYFSQGVIGKIFKMGYPYQMPSVNMIGDIYYDRPEMTANTGYMADAYANMGFMGMIVIGLLFVAVLILIDSLATKIGKEIVVGLSIFHILSLNDGAFLTSMLTGGFLFLLVVLYLYSNTKDYYMKS